jgi:hypothetical protein
MAKAVIPLPNEDLYSITSIDVKNMLSGLKDKKQMYTGLQFIPGVVGVSITSENQTWYKMGGNGEGNERNINSILAMPHIGYKGLKKISSLGENNRYYPLLRGMVDVPTPGDPVLLCQMGDTQYYLGPLNTQNLPNFNDDDFPNNFLKATTSSTASGNVKSVRSIKDNSFIPTSTGRLHKNQNTILDFPANKKDGFISNNSSPDMIFEGRHGNSIRIGSRNINPYIMISNGRTITNTQESSLDNSIFALFKHGSIRQHFIKDAKKENKDKKLNELIKPYSFKLADEEIPEVFKSISKTYQKNIGRGNLETGEDDKNIESTIYKYGEKKNQGQAFLSSDRITFNARKDSIFLSAFQHIHLGSGNTMTFSTSKNILFEAMVSSITNTGLFKVNATDTVEIDGRKRITLGSPTKDGVQPAVLGDNLLLCLTTLCNDIKGALLDVSKAIEQRSKAGESLKTMQAAADNIDVTKEFVENIVLSNKVFLK